MELIELATAYNTARELYSQLSQMNRSSDPAKMVENDLAYRRAEKAVVAARLAYEAALDKEIGA